jgi:hypothetical protein
MYRRFPFALVVLAFVPCGCHRSGGVTVVSPQPAWVTLSPPGAGFSVEVPGSAKESTLNVPSPAGQLAAHVYQVSSPDGRMEYDVVYSDYPSGIILQPDGALNGARDGAVKQVGGRLLSEQKLMLGEFPGKEIRIEVATNRIAARQRFYLVKLRLYQLVLLVPLGTPEPTDADRFFNSFKLTEH